MWQIICLCLPAVTPSERQRFFALFRNALHASGREADEMDLSLFFLHTLSSQEALTVLEERLHLVVRSQELMGQQRAMESARDIRQWVIDDHLRTLLSAEHEWLKRTIAQLQNVQPDQEPGSSHATSEQVCSVYQTRAVKPSASAVGIEGAFLIKMAWTASPRNRSPRSDGAFRGRASEKPPA